jgi:cyclase
MLKLLVCSIIAVSLNAFDYGLHPKKVAEGVYCFFGVLQNVTSENGGNIVNTCFVQTKEGFVVIDSGPTYDYAFQAYAQMQKIAKLPVKYVIVTHDHDDHWQGNSFYKSKGALLIGPKTYEQNVVAGMPTRMHRILGDAVYGKTKIVTLDNVVE